MPRAVPLLMLLTGLCSACAAKPAPVVLAMQPCARPAKPALPALSGVFLESREGYTILRVRDARIRAYVAGLEDALACYEAQTSERNNHADPHADH